ncbi:MAG TPA: methylmalonyl Co-A mutase-associated GTPase MeaB, partial [Catalimonadaceae bacterium]|nr:methylmalonyl Co-A mutase-associated GTPase MeaB [Catalimonadaceae bacterium]
MNEQEWLEKIQSGDRLALSKAITLVESDFADHQQKARSLMAEIEKVSSSSFRLAITGVPGAGKSTLINKIGINWIEKGHKVAVLA